MTKDPGDQSLQPKDELFVVELDERLEFGAAIIDSDLEADNNSGCTNTDGCATNNYASCTNSGCSAKFHNDACTNRGC